MSIRAFFLDGKVTLYTDDMPIFDRLLPGLELTPLLVFEEAEPRSGGKRLIAKILMQALTEPAVLGAQSSHWRDL